jgi:hypothetical protein
MASNGVRRYTTDRAAGLAERVVADRKCRDCLRRSRFLGEVRQATSTGV